MFSLHVSAQVSVSATGGLPTTQYTTLKGAFDAINIGLHTGQVFITLTGSTTETATATLNASGGLANYTRVNIIPSVACTISGNIAGALIHLNGADSVTIDGRINGIGSTRSLTIQNTYSGNFASSYTIMMSNFANRNIVRYTICEGLRQLNWNGATIYSTSSNYNKIEFNEVKPVGVGWQRTGVSGCDTVRDNLVYDFYGSNNSGISAGVYGCSVVSGNSLYHTRPITDSLVFGQFYIYGGSFISKNSLGGSQPYCQGATAVFSGQFVVTGIYSQAYIDSNTISNIQINGNPFGGFTGIGYGGSGAFVNANGNTIGSLSDTSAIVVYNGGIVGISVFGGVSNSIGRFTNNKIGGLTSVGTGNNTNASFRGIYVDDLDSAIIDNNVVGGNMIGSVRIFKNTSMNVGISIARSKHKARIYCRNNTIQNLYSFASTSSAAHIHAIFSSGQLNDTSRRWIAGNFISNIHGANDTGAMIISGIHSAIVVGNAALSSNITRNHVSNLVVETGSSHSYVVGINHEAPYGNYLNIDSNTISNLSNNSPNTNTNLNVSVQGIRVISSFSAPANINANKIFGLTNISSASSSVAGINCYYNAANPMSISANRIYDLSVPNGTNGLVSGIMAGSPGNGYFMVKNNMVSLQPPASTTAFGINNYLQAAQIKCYYNSVHIGGTATGSNYSAAFTRSSFANTPIFLQNNIFQNLRTGGTGNHYAVMNGNPVPDTGWTYSNYNNFYAAPGNPLMLWGSSVHGFSSYQAISYKDSCSKNLSGSFVGLDTANLHLTNNATNLNLEGRQIAGITNDFDNDPRNVLPTIGADELQLPYQAVSIPGPAFTMICPNKTVTLKASTNNLALQWYRNGTAIVGATADSINVTLPGSYTVFGSQGCVGNLSNAVFVSVLPIKRDSITASICQKTSYTIAGKNYYATGIYRDTLTSSNGCDSIITLNLTVKYVNDTVLVNGSTLTAASLSGSHKWVTCPGYYAIPGQTWNSFTPSWSGSFALIINNFGCADTSDCIFVAGLSVDSLNQQLLSVYPNPSAGSFTFTTPSAIEKIEITDLTGKTILTAAPNANSFSIDLKGKAAGVYFYSVKSGEKVKRGKLLLE